MQEAWYSFLSEDIFRYAGSENRIKTVSEMFHELKVVAKPFSGAVNRSYVKAVCHASVLDECVSHLVKQKQPLQQKSWRSDAELESRISPKNTTHYSVYNDEWLACPNNKYSQTDTNWARKRLAWD